MRTGFLALAVLFFFISPFVTTAADDDNTLAWVSYCRGKLEKASLVDSKKAANLFRGKAPFCVFYEEGSYDPSGLTAGCESGNVRPKPWESSEDVKLVATLPAGADASDYEVVITVIAPEAPFNCASCDPSPQCEPNTHDITKTFRLTFSGKERRKAWSVIKSMQPAEGREFLSIKATAELKKKGQTVTEKTINITWPYCC